MQLRRRHGELQNVLICFPESSTTSCKVLALQIARLDVEGYLRAQYPQATKIIYLPQTFSTIVKVINKKGIGCSYYQDLILHRLSCHFGKNMKRFDAIDDDFPTDRSVEDWSINCIIDEYIAIALPTLQRSQRQKTFLIKVNEAKAQWNKKRASRQRVELYLGINDFDSELKRSCAEFYSELRKALGGNPLRWYYIN